MAVRLRLSRVGKKNAPMYRIIAIDSRKMRDGAHLDNLGTYNPTTDEYVQSHVERFEEWLKKGALPTDSVNKLYKRFKLGKRTTVAETLVAPAPIAEPVVTEIAAKPAEPAASVEEPVKE